MPKKPLPRFCDRRIHQVLSTIEELHEDTLRLYLSIAEAARYKKAAAKKRKPIPSRPKR